MTVAVRVASIERETGISWFDWMAFMKEIGAHGLPHHAIAAKVLEKLERQIGNPAWWAQSITVAYEQEIGRRLPGQQADGTFQTSVSKATSLSMESLIDRWTRFADGDDEVRSLIASEPRVSGTEKRISWRANSASGSAINVLCEAKKGETSRLVVQLIGHETVEQNDAARAVWSGIVGRFVASRT